MLPPHELKNKGFGHALRGYSPAEVDDYIEFLLERYAEVYRHNDQLEKEMRLANVRLEELTAKEDAINRALVNAQRLEDKIINDAKDQAEIITRAAKTNADKILNDFKRKISKERQTLHELRKQVAEFKSEVLDHYVAHITALKAIAPELDGEPEWENTEDDYTTMVIDGIRTAACNAGNSGDGKAKLDDILLAHTEEAVSDDTVETIDTDKVSVSVETVVEKTEPEVETDEKVPVTPIKIPGIKKRPRARRTIDRNGVEMPKTAPIPASPGEESDTEDALDKLFSDSGSGR